MSLKDLDIERQLLIHGNVSTRILPVHSPSDDTRNSFSYISTVNYQLRNDLLIVIPSETLKSATTLGEESPLQEPKTDIERSKIWKQKLKPSRQFWYGLLAVLILALGISALVWALTMKGANSNDRNLAVPVEGINPPAPTVFEAPKSQYTVVVLNNVENPSAISSYTYPSSIIVAQTGGMVDAPLDPFSFVGPVSVYKVPGPSKISAVAATLSGAIYFAREIDTNFTVLSRISKGGNIEDLTGLLNILSLSTPITEISALASSSAGDIFISNPENNLIWKYTSSGFSKFAYAVNAYRLAIREADVYFTAKGSNAIRRADATGRTYPVVTTKLPGIGTLNTFSNPQGLAVTPNGNLIVADVGNNQIKMINLDSGQVSLVLDLGQLDRDETVDVVYVDGNVVASFLSANKLLKIVPNPPQLL